MAGARHRHPARGLPAWRTAMILTALYLPVAIMLIGLILRGVAFEFRVKAPGQYKRHGTALFFAGSLLTSLSQGFMLGLYIMGLEWTLAARGLRLPHGGVPDRGLQLHRRDVADPEDRRHPPAQGRRMGQGRDLGPDPRHRRDLGGLAARQPPHLPEVVRLPRDALARAAADPVGRADLLALAQAPDAARAGRPRLAGALRRLDPAVHAGLRGARLLLLPLRGARSG